VHATLADREVEDYSETISMFKGNPKVAPFFSSAFGYAVFPTNGKGGLSIGASHGKGQVYRGGAVTGFTSFSDISIGFQAGGQAYSQVVFFENQSAYDNFSSGNFEFDAQASAIAITASAQASSGTTGTTASAGADGAGKQVAADFRKGMLVFVIGKGGLMYQAAIGGQKYGFEAAK
jgi:lipid-binding SYLF domain-containing protein